MQRPAGTAGMKMAARRIGAVVTTITAGAAGCTRSGGRASGSAIDIPAMADAHHQNHQLASPGASQRLSIASITRTRSALGSAASGFSAESLIRSEHRIPHLSPAVTSTMKHSATSKRCQ